MLWRAVLPAEDEPPVGVSEAERYPLLELRLAVSLQCGHCLPRDRDGASARLRLRLQNRGDSAHQNKDWDPSGTQR